jgi:hypothetical protein
VSKERSRDERAGCHGRDGIDFVHRPVRKPRDDRPPLRRAQCGEVLRFRGRVELEQDIGKAHRLAELHAHAPVAPNEDVDRANEAADVLLLLVAATELMDEGFFLDESLVSDAYRTEPSRACRHGKGGVYDERQEAETRGQQLAGTRSSTLEEELERRAVAEHATHIRIDHGRVEPVATERASDEEGPRPAEERAHRKKVEVVACRDERQGQLVAVEEPREDHVVHVRLVRWKQNEVALFGVSAKLLDSRLVHFDRREHASRGAGNHALVGGHRVHVESSLELAQHGLRPRGDDGALLRAFAGHVRDDLLELRAPKHLFAQAIGRLLGRTDDRAPLALEPTEQGVGQATEEHVVAHARWLARQKVAQIDRLAGPKSGVAPVTEKLSDRANVPRPLARSEKRVRQISAEHSRAP